MRIPFLIARFLTGALFVFSGIVKLNDPSGFGIKLNEYFDVFAQDLATPQDSMRLVVYSGGQKLIDQKTVLYSFDKEKEMVLEAHGLEEEADSGSMLRKINVRCYWGGSSVAETTVDAMRPIAESKSIDFDFVALTPGQELPSEKSSFNPKQANRLLFPVSTLGLSNGDSSAVNWSDISVSESLSLDVSTHAKPNGMLFDFFKWFKNYSLYLSVFFCALEVLLGLAMLIGWNIRLTIGITAALIVFFTFLTGYSAYFNKVTDCGCFGDFLKLKPWHSFYKDLILLGLVSVMMLGMKHNVPWFSKHFGVKLMGVFTVLTVWFGVYCYLYLPVWDFLPYKVGNNIWNIMTEVPEGQRASDSIEITWVLYKPKANGGIDSISCTTAEFSKKMEEGYQYDDQKSQRRKLVIEGYKSPIHDFAINDDATGADMKDSFLQTTAFQLAYVIPYLETANLSEVTQLQAILAWAKKQGVRVYGLSAVSQEPAKEFLQKHNLPMKMYSADQKMLITMARYNPTLYLMRGPVVLGKWSGIDLPSPNRLDKLRKKALVENTGLAKVLSGLKKS
ncbi:MAG: hypothetical protein FJ333_02110 [Sphingomonadales bacterium]|nr:hypothetical protein [Sphingomonadales bacterium]